MTVDTGSRPRPSPSSSSSQQQHRRVGLQADAKRQTLANQLSDAIVTYHELLSECDAKESPIEYSAILSNIAVLYRRKGKPAEALRIYRQAVQIMEELNDMKGDDVGVADRLHLFQIYQNEASLYRYLEDNDSSFDVYQKMIVLIDGIVHDMDVPEQANISSLSVERRRRHHHLSIQAKSSYGRLHNIIGNLYLREGEYFQSLDHFIQSVSWFRNAWDTDMSASSLYGISSFKKIEMVEPLSNIAKSYLHKHELQKTLTAWEDVLKILREEVEADNPMILAVLNNLAVVHDLVGNKTSADSNHKRILAIRSNKLGDSHAQTNVSMIHVGNILIREGKLEEAMNTFTKALASFRNAFDHFHPLVAGALYCIGNVHYRLGNYQKALEQFEEACLIRKSALGELDPSVADVCIAIGQVFRKLGSTEEARNSFLSALHIFEEHSCDESHPSVQKIINNISPAAANTTIDEIIGKDQWFLDENSFGDSQSTDISELVMLDSVIDSGKFRQVSTSGQLSEATESLSTHNQSEQQLDNNQQPFGSENIAMLVSNKGKQRIENDRAILLFVEKLRSLEASTGSNQNEIADTFVDIGNIFFERGDNDKSIRLYQEALLLQQDEMSFALALQKLADVYVRKGFYEQALESYSEALEMYRSVNLSEDHMYIKRILKNISDTLDEEQRCF